MFHDVCAEKGSRYKSACRSRTAQEEYEILLRTSSRGYCWGFRGVGEAISTFAQLKRIIYSRDYTLHLFGLETPNSSIRQIR